MLSLKWPSLGSGPIVAGRNKETLHHAPAFDEVSLFFLRFAGLRERNISEKHNNYKKNVITDRVAGQRQETHLFCIFFGDRKSTRLNSSHL